MGIPNIEEIRAITKQRNENDIQDYMNKERTAIINGIQQDARSGHSCHIHTWMDTTKTTLATRSSHNFKKALELLQKEFQEAGYEFQIDYVTTPMQNQTRISDVVISW